MFPRPRGAFSVTCARWLPPAGLHPIAWETFLHPAMGGDTQPRLGRCHLSGRTTKWETARVPLSVVLAEDSYLMRVGVSRLIETDKEMALVGTGHDLYS